MICVTITWQESATTERVFDELGADEQNAIAYIVALYPEMTMEQRKSIRVSQNGMKCTNSTMLAVENIVRERGWAVPFPVAVVRPAPKCPKCDSLFFIKIGRYPDGKCRVWCHDCKHEAALTNGEYYTTIVDADQD